MLRAIAPTLASCVLALGILACDRGQGSGSSKDTTCPPCECACAQADTDAIADANGPNADPSDPATEPPIAGPGSASDDPYAVSEIIASANRKMMHGDGAGCLAELDRVDALAPKFVSHLVVTRAQCEMLVGKCQEGKDKIIDFYMREMAMGKELAAKTAESIASMRCKGGDSSERDRLLAAYYDLQDGAYMNKRDVDYCKQRVATIEDLAPRVKPRDAEDSMITGGRQALFHTSAMCFARAGDCDLAYAYYRRLFPPDAVQAIPDPQLLETTIRDSFSSSIVLCDPQQP